MLDIIWNLGAFVIALGILITIHEYGHFWVARKNQVKVERFSIGFGQTIWRRFDKHGTEFVIALIPLGGYVKMLDERVDEVKAADKAYTFNSKSVYQRIAIIAAGPLANFLFAILAFALMFIIGIQSIKPVVGQLADNSPASVAELPINAEIIRVNGKRVVNWQDFSMAVAANLGEKKLKVETQAINFNSDEVTPVITSFISMRHISDNLQDEDLISQLGIIPYRPEVFKTVAQVEKSGPADLSGLKVGDEFLSVNAQKVDSWTSFTEIIKQYPNQTVNITVLREENIISLQANLKSMTRNGIEIGYLGVAPKVAPWPEELQESIEYNPAQALVKGAIKTWDLTVLSIEMIGKLLTGDLSVKNLSGPISIAQGAGTSASFGLVSFLGFLGLISINLGVINLLPLPVLDGGHLFYYLIEVVTGKPVPENIQAAGFKFGAIALLGLMSIALFNDISRL